MAPYRSDENERNIVGKRNVGVNVIVSWRGISIDSATGASSCIGEEPTGGELCGDNCNTNGEASKITLKWVVRKQAKPSGDKA